MTKIKNTKKDMAKKTLSVSLAVAMLATSNVPVWAAEFSDGSEAAFTSEAPVEVEAPVVEEDTVEAPVAEAQNEGYDFSTLKYDTNFNWKRTANPFISGTIKNEEGSDALVSDLGYVWLLDGKEMSGSVWTNLTGDISLNKNMIGSELSVRFYEKMEDSSLDKNVLIKEISFGTIQPVDISTELSITSIDDQTYCGKVPEVTPTITAVNWSDFQVYASSCGVTGAAEGWFTYDYNSNNGANAGATVTVTGTLKADVAEKLGYAGTITAQYTIEKCTNLSSDDVEITMNTSAAGEYTGANIELPGNAATVKLKDTNIELPLKKVVTKSSDATIIGTTVNSNADVQVYYDTDAMNATGNFNLLSGWEHTVSQATSISQRDLEKCTASLNVTYTKENVNASGFAVRRDRLTIKDASGKVLSLKDSDVKISLVDQKYDHVGTYSKAIIISAKSDNCVNKTYADLVITEKNFDADNATFENASTLGLFGTASEAWSSDKGVEFQNKDITFTKDDLGNFYPKGNAGEYDNFSFNITYANNKNASTQNSLATITVSGKAGSDYEGYSKTFYFKVKPAVVKATSNSTTTTVTTSVKDTVKGVEVVSGASAEDYKDEIGLVLKAKNQKTDLNPEADTFELVNGTDYTCEYSFVSSNKSDLTADDDKNVVGQFVKVVATLKNTNYAVDDNDVTSAANAVDIDGNKTNGTVTVYVPLVAKTIANAEVTLDKATYVYTGKNIIPKVTVKAGDKVLKEGIDYNVKVENGIDAGTATVVITATEASGYREGSQITKNFTIAKANAEDLTVTITNADSIKYTGTAWNASNVNYTIKLGDYTLSNDSFKATWGTNIDAGKTSGSLTLTPKTATAKNIEGVKDVSFEIKGDTLTGTLKLYDENGTAIVLNSVDGDDTNADKNVNEYFEYTGSAVTIAKVEFIPSDGQKLVEDKDYEITYIDNISSGEAYVCVTGKGNYVGEDSLYDENGDKIDNIVTGTRYRFWIDGKEFKAKDITVKNGVYASGLVVKPNVTVVKGNKTLVEGIDYKLEFDANEAINVTSTNSIRFAIKGLGEYNTTYIDKDATGKWLVYGIEKFDLANATVTVDETSVIVRNGNVVVPSTEYTAEVKDDTVTITATTGNKNYTGSKTVDVEKEDTFVEAPMISDVQVTGNTATVILSGESDGATGYDYVISKDINCTTSKDYDKVNKNILTTESDFTYVQKGTYYAYCHAWKRVDGKKVFSGWSNVFPFVVTATTPDQPVITSVKASGSTVTVTYTQAANATGYDVVLGSAVKKVNGETRPVNYGELVKKNIKDGVVTATFKNVPAGTYYAGLHAFNRTSESGTKVFSPWSNYKKVTVK